MHRSFVLTAALAVSVHGHEEYLIFSEDFDDDFDLSIWKHDITLGGNGNREFQAYVNSRNNSYVKDGKLHLRATLTDEAYGDYNVHAGVMDLWGTSPYSSCSSPQFNGCRKQSIGKDILPPVQSARIQTMESFSFKYGRIEIKTKLPKGDWLWPGIWMMAKDNKYGPWPSSGELDIMESRGNGPNYTDDHGNPIGNNRFSSCFHFGPAWNKDGYPVAVNDTQALPDGRSYGEEFHTFGFYWDQEEMYSYVDTPDNIITRVAEYGKKSFWDIGIDAGAWNASDTYNNFQDGPINAPFDQEMYLIMNVAVGGTSIAKGFLDSGYFPDDRGGKPWHTNDTFPLYNFYTKKADWIDSWKQGGQFSSDMSAMQIDSVKVWGLKGLTTFTNSKNPVHSYQELDVQGESCQACADFADALPACINPQTQACFAKSHLAATCFDSTTPCQPPAERLIFHDAFDTLDESKWQHEITMTGTANNFMNMFVKRRENAHVDNGRLILTPTLTEPVFGTLDNSTIDLWGNGFGEQCTSNYNFGCLQTGNAAQILPPILSSSLRTEKSFSFKYGRIELRAKLPKGNWLRPTFRLLPKYDSYGEHPQSGDIIVLEGNGNVVNENVQVQSGIAFGAFNDTRMDKSHLHLAADGAFHTYGLYWDENELYTYVDDPTNVIEKVNAYGDVSFWNQHWDPSLENDISPWRNRPLHAPFDQLMYLNIALRVGGIDGFYDNAVDDKPWNDEAINYKSTFYQAKDSWLPTWSGSFEIDDIKVWATSPKSQWAYHGSFDVEPTIESTSLDANAHPTIFSDSFDTLNMRKWKPEITMNTGGFHMNVNHRQTSYVKNATLFLHPALSRDFLGEWMLTQGWLDMWGTDIPSKCTLVSNNGCGHLNTPKDMAKPIHSASLRTAETFSFRYGTLEIAATLATGDWLLSSIKLVPMSGSDSSIIILSARGNKHLEDGEENLSWRRVYSGVCMDSTKCNMKSQLLSEVDAPKQHLFGVNWSPDEIITYIDDPSNIVSRQPTPPSLQQDAYLVVSLGVGGTSQLEHEYFPNTPSKPWTDTEPYPHTTFYANREKWWPTWATADNNKVGQHAALKIHSVEVNALTSSGWRYHRLVGDADQTLATLQTASEKAQIPMNAIVSSMIATYTGPAEIPRLEILDTFKAYVTTAFAGENHVLFGATMIDTKLMATVAYTPSQSLNSIENHAHFQVDKVQTLTLGTASMMQESRHLLFLRMIVYVASGVMLALLSLVLVRWGLNRLSRRIYLIVFVCTTVAAVPCTSTQKQQMLNAITSDSEWPTCQAATAPYDFYTSLTQGGPPPTTAQSDLFNGSPACTNVYTHFQDALKQANCDQIQNLIGVPSPQFVTLTMGSPPTTAPVAHSNVVDPSTIITFAPNTLPSSSTHKEKDQMTLVKSGAGTVNPQITTVVGLAALALCF